MNELSSMIPVLSNTWTWHLIIKTSEVRSMEIARKDSTDVKPFLGVVSNLHLDKLTC